MKKEDKERILHWLRGRRDWSEGVALYQQLGCNIRLKREFAFGETPLLAGVLVEQLMGLANVDEISLRRIPISAPKPVPAYTPASEPVKELLRFRDRYPFLKSDDCPAQLKAMVTDMFTAYEAYKTAHEHLSELPAEEREKAFDLCGETVEKFLENRRIWEVLDHYKEFGTFPDDMGSLNPPTPSEEIASLSDLEIAGKLKSAVTNESKHRKAVRIAEAKGENNEKAEAQLQYWTHRKKALQEEINRRKKK